MAQMGPCSPFEAADSGTHLKVTALLPRRSVRREFEAHRKDCATNAEFREKMKGCTDLWVTGNGEILQIV